MNFEVYMNDFNLVSEKGYPEDGEFCWLIWKTYSGEYEFSFGGYFEDKKEFYGNCGLMKKMLLHGSLWENKKCR